MSDFRLPGLARAPREDGARRSVEIARKEQHKLSRVAHDFDLQLLQVKVWRKEGRDIEEWPQWAKDIDRAARLVQREWREKVKLKFQGRLNGLLEGDKGPCDGPAMVKMPWGWKTVNDPWTDRDPNRRVSKSCNHVAEDAVESNQLKAKLMADGDDAGGGRQRQQETGEEGKDVGFTAPLASKQVGGDEVPDPDLDETESGESDSGVCAESGHATSLAGSSLARTGEQPPEGNGESAHTPKQANPSLAGRSNSGDVHAMSLSGQYRASKAKKPAGESHLPLGMSVRRKQVTEARDVILGIRQEFYKWRSEYYKIHLGPKQITSTDDAPSVAQFVKWTSIMKIRMLGHAERLRHMWVDGGKQGTPTSLAEVAERLSFLLLQENAEAAVSAFRNFDKAIQKDAGSVCGTVVVEVERWLCFMLESFEALLSEKDSCHDAPEVAREGATADSVQPGRRDVLPVDRDKATINQAIPDGLPTADVCIAGGRFSETVGPKNGEERREPPPMTAFGRAMLARRSQDSASSGTGGNPYLKRQKNAEKTQPVPSSSRDLPFTGNKSEHHRRDGGSHHLAWSSLDNSAFLRQPSSRHAKLIATQRKPTKGSQNSTEQAGAPTPPPISLSLPMGKHRPSHVVGTPSHPLSSSDIELATGRNIFQSAAKPATQHGARVVGARSLFQPTTQPTTSQGVRLAGSSSLFKPTTQQTTENEIELSRSKGLLEATGMPARNRIFEENPHISKPDVQKSGHRNPQRRSIDFNQRSISTDLQPLQSHARRSFDLIRAQHNGYSGASSTPIDSASERQVLPPLVAYP